MKTRFKHIHFDEVKGLAAPLWVCDNNKSNDCLGQVVWITAWKRFVFEPLDMAEFDSGCLRDIATFLDTLKQEIRP